MCADVVALVDPSLAVAIPADGAVDRVPLAAPCLLGALAAPCPLGAGCGAVGLTEKSVPVVTVTSAPPVVGP